MFLWYCDEPGPPTHLSIFLPPPGTLVRMHRATLCSFGRNIRPHCRDCVTCSTNCITSFSPWTRRHHSTNSDLVHAKLLCIHTGEHHHRDSEEPSSHITPCIFHIACKRQHFCDQITVRVCSSLVNFASFPLSKNTSTCKTSGVFDLVAIWPKSSNSEFDSFWRIDSSHEFWNFHSGQFFSFQLFHWTTSLYFYICSQGKHIPAIGFDSNLWTE